VTEFYIHNLNFDGLLIIEDVSLNNIKYDMLTNKTNIYYIKIFYINKYIKFRCSFKLLPLSLKKIGELENVQKYVFPYKFIEKKTLFYDGPVPNRSYWEHQGYDTYIKYNKSFNTKNETIKYCTQDVIITNKFLQNILKIINEESKKIINNSYSIASLSHKLFYLKYNNKNIEEKILKKDEAYVRNAYFGGRCEVFGNIYQHEHIKYFDFSGMYGQCMLEKFHNGRGEYRLNCDYNHPGFHTIEYESNMDFLPVLPSHSSDGKLVFTNGSGVGTYWFEEIILFVNMGGVVKKIINSFIYDKYEKVFTDFIDSFTNIKKKDGYYRIFGKLMINSLYGGMALNATSDFFYITFSENEFYDILEKMNISTFYKVNNSFILLIKNDYKSKKYFEKNNSNKSSRNVSYAAAIASKARIKLYKALKSVLDDGGRILYCDTDSIFAAYNKKNKDKKLNDDITWLDFFDDGIFIAPKIYATTNSSKTEIKIKGISEKNISFDEIKESFFNNKEIIFNDQLNIKKYNFTINQTYINKKINLNKYDKRIFIDGNRNTIPINKNAPVI
jgi:hypothetical protein